MNKILIVGLGSIGRRHTDNFSNFFDKIDIADINEERIKQAKNEYKINESFLDYNEALRLNKYDAVAITTPPHLHLDIAKLAVEKNCHLFIEKPLGMNIDGWSELEERIKEKKLISYVAYCHRHINFSKRLKEIIDQGLIGTPIHSNMRWGSYLPDWHPWEDYRTFYMAKKEQGGGALLDESHGIDLVRYVLGDVESVFGIVGKLSSLEISSDDTALLTLTMTNKSLVQINFDLVSRSPRCSFEIVGSKGTVIWDRINFNIELFTSENKKWTEELFTKEDLLEMYSTQAKHFVDCIKRKEESLISIDEAINTQKVIDATFESSLQKTLIKIK